MRSLLLALTAFAALALTDTGEARAQMPRNNNASNNPLMPNLGVPYTNMQQARSMLYRSNRGRGRNRNAHRPTGNRPVIINNYYGGRGPASPF